MGCSTIIIWKPKKPNPSDFIMKALEENRKIKICLLSEMTNIWTKRWVEALLRDNFQVYLISFNPSALRGINPKNLFVLKKINFPIKKIFHFLNGIFYLIQTKEILRKIQPNILHAHFVTNYGTIGALTGFSPFIVSAWGSDIFKIPKDSKFKYYLTKYVLNKADIITVTATFTKIYLFRIFGISPSKIVRIPWGINLDVFKPGYKQEIEKCREKLKIKNTNFPIVLSNRHLNPKYNIEKIIEAIPYVIKEYPETFFIFLKGSGNGNYEKKIKTLISKMGIEKNISIIPRFISSKEMAVYLNLADIFISIPYTDQFGSSVMEGMACGTIPIVSDIEVYKQYLEDGKNAFFVNPDDPEDISEKIILASKNFKKIQEKFFKINRKIIEENENWDRNIKEMEKLYKNLLNNRFKNE